MQVPSGDTYEFLFTTRAFATGIPGTLGGTPVLSAYEEANLTQITAGVSISADYDSVTGLNQAVIVATTGNGFEVGKYYSIVITTGTVDSVSVVGEVVGHFRIMAAEGVAAVPDVNVTHVGDTAQTAGDLQALITTVDTVVDGIQTDLSNGTDGLGALKSLIDTVDSEVGVIDGIVDTILVDTADMQPRVAAIETDTGTTLQAELDAIQAAVITNAAGVDIAADIIAMKAETALIVADTNELQTDNVPGLISTLDAVVDTVKAETALIVADTNELQTDWANGGRLDLILDAASAPTAAAVADAVWDEALSGHVVAGSFGKATADIETDATAILADTNELQTDWADGGRLDLILDAASAPSAAAVADAVWDEAQSGHVGAGTFGEMATEVAAILVDTNELQSDDVPGLIATLDAVVDTVKAETALIVADTNELQSDDVPGLISALDTVVDRVETDTQDLQTQIGTAGAGLTDLGGMSTAMKAEVNVEALDVINTDTRAEPAQGTPGATISLGAKIDFLFKAWRNKSTQTATQYALFNDDAATVDHKATVSDDATTATKGEVTTGP